MVGDYESLLVGKVTRVPDLPARDVRVLGSDR
jgi:hypothetical protein